MHEKEGFADALIFGDKGSGKSTYALISAYQVYNDWEEVFRHLVFDPEKAIRLIKEALEDGVRIPMLIMDDAGLWLGKSEWWEQRKIRFSEFYNVIREICSCVVFTTPSDDIIGRLLKQIGLRIKITLSDEKLSIAKVYKVKISPLFQQYIKTLKQEVFVRHLPDETYERYKALKRKATYNKLVEWELSVNQPKATLVAKALFYNDGIKRHTILKPSNGGSEVLESYHGKYVAFEIKAVGNSLSEVQRCVEGMEDAG